MKRTIHDGSRSYSVEVPNPEPGKGKHAKTLLQVLRRRAMNGSNEALDELLSLNKLKRR